MTAFYQNFKYVPRNRNLFFARIKRKTSDALNAAFLPTRGRGAMTPQSRIAEIFNAVLERELE